MSLWWPGEWDRLLSKFEDWIVKRHGYSKLQPRLLSRGYQSMMTKNKPRSEPVCTTFHFSNAEEYRESRISMKSKDSKRIYTHKPSSVEVTNDIDRVPELCLNSLDKMEMVLKRYERAFSKLQKRGPQRSSTIHNLNIDLLNEDVIQNIFLKCYQAGNRNNYEIATTKI